MAQNSKPAKLNLITAPTPLHELGRLSDLLGGPRIHIKRDDLIPLGFGGNKVRKLDYLIAAALAEGATDIVTMGAVQSNHCRQTAAIAAQYGLASHLVLAPGAIATPDYQDNGNVVLDRILGAELHYCPIDGDPDALFNEVMLRLQDQGKRPYAIPIGGSNPLGSLGYYDVIGELATQVDLKEYRALIVTSGSSGTHAGLAMGVLDAGLDTEVIGISCSQPIDVQHNRIAVNMRGMQPLLAGGDRHSERDIARSITVFDQYVGEKYGVPTEAGLEAIRLCARREGIFFDPVYTGKAMAGLFDLIGKGHFSRSDKLIFIHTGGSPALFGYNSACFL